MRIGTLGTLFSGGEGVGVGARAAGLEHAWGIESDDDIAEVARMNGFDVTVADVRAADPSGFGSIDVLHASPPCTTASQANSASAWRAARTGSRETPLDYELARAVVGFINHHRPTVFTLENVYGYRKYQAFELILKTLYSLNYHWVWWHANMANYGVPQTRRRLVLVAHCGGRARKPATTHGEIIAPMFDDCTTWVGWYDAVADIIDAMRPDELADWQLERLPDVMDTCLIDSAGYPGADGARVPVVRYADQTANTIVANHARRPMRAYLRAGVSGRVVRISVRGLARFQSFPDSYILPPNALGVRVVGNAVPPLFYQRLMEAQIHATDKSYG
jgi:DNA (cytosine-5)-methyltransferase 1